MVQKSEIKNMLIIAVLVQKMYRTAVLVPLFFSLS